MIITLGDSDLIGSGGRQLVFNNPHNALEIIKVSKKNISTDKFTFLEQAKFAIMPYKRRLWIRDAYDSYRQYINILATIDRCPNYIAGHHGFVQTSIGIGCVYEKVCDEGHRNKVSLTVSDIIRCGDYKERELANVLDIFFDSIFRDRVHISDLTLDNLCVVRNALGRCERIVLVDGLGRKTLIPLSISRAVYSRWHKQMRMVTHVRIGQLMKSTYEQV